MTTGTFSRQNDTGSRARSNEYREDLVLVVVLVLESKGLKQQTITTATTEPTKTRQNQNWAYDKLNLVIVFSYFCVYFHWQVDHRRQRWKA